MAVLLTAAAAQQITHGVSMLQSVNMKKKKKTELCPFTVFMTVKSAIIPV
jgi:hypothetical protein